MNTVVRWILMAVAGVAVVGAGIGVAIHRAGASTPAPADSNAAVLDALKAIAAKLDARPAKEVSPTGTPFRPYADARALAISSGKPLLVWINYRCPSTARQLPDMVHAFTDGTGEYAHGATAQRVDVYGPGLVYVASVHAADCCATNIRAALVPRPVQGASVGGPNEFVGLGVTVDHNCPT